MKLYCCNLLLHDYLFFATTERGKVAETGPFIHNYALTYALGWAISSWHNEIQKPNYREELAKVRMRYVTPARLVRGSTLLNQYNTMSEIYGLGKKDQSIGYPDWGFIKCYRPGALFQCYILSAEDVRIPRYIRLGKFMTKTALHVTEAQNVQIHMEPLVTREVPYANQYLLAWNDLSPAARPLAFDIIANALPGRLIANPAFDGIVGPYVRAIFADRPTPLQLPLRMGYYGEKLCASW